MQFESSYYLFVHFVSRQCIKSAVTVLIVLQIVNKRAETNGY